MSSTTNFGLIGNDIIVRWELFNSAAYLAPGSRVEGSIEGGSRDEEFREERSREGGSMEEGIREEGLSSTELP